MKAPLTERSLISVSELQTGKTCCSGNVKFRVWIIWAMQLLNRLPPECCLTVWLSEATYCIPPSVNFASTQQPSNHFNDLLWWSSPIGQRLHSSISNCLNQITEDSSSLVFKFHLCSTATFWYWRFSFCFSCHISFLGSLRVCGELRHS